MQTFQVYFCASAEATPLHATFYSAPGLKVDAILSYPWLCQNGLDVLVSQQALSLRGDGTNRVLLHSFPFDHLALSRHGSSVP